MLSVAGVSFEAMKYGLCEIQATGSSPLLSDVFQKRDVGNVGGNLRLDEPELSIVVLQRRFWTSASNACGLHQTAAQSYVDRGKMLMYRSQLFDKQGQLRQARTLQLSDRWLAGGADSQRAPSIGVACQ